MTINSWEPNTSNNHEDYQVDIGLLKEIAGKITAKTPVDVSTYIAPNEQKKHQAMMQLPKEHWFTLADNFTNNDIIALIKFFTLAEMQIQGWGAAEKSPVIWLTKILRQKGEKLDKDLLVWIKSISSNKFLPYGAL